MEGGDILKGNSDTNAYRRSLEDTLAAALAVQDAVSLHVRHLQLVVGDLDRGRRPRERSVRDLRDLPPAA
jgi:hypothetical protein